MSTFTARITTSTFTDGTYVKQNQPRIKNILYLSYHNSNVDIYCTTHELSITTLHDISTQRLFHFL